MMPLMKQSCVVISLATSQGNSIPRCIIVGKEALTLRVKKLIFTICSEFAVNFSKLLSSPCITQKDLLILLSV